MPGAEISNVNSVWIDGVLRFRNQRSEDVLEIGATTGIPAGAHYQTNTTIAAATTLTVANCGRMVLCSTDSVVVTLPLAALPGLTYTIMNTASDGGALLVVKGAATTEVFQGNAVSATTATACKNTALTQRFGDCIGLRSTASVTWIITNVVGTWAVGIGS